MRSLSGQAWLLLLLVLLAAGCLVWLLLVRRRRAAAAVQDHQRDQAGRDGRDQPDEPVAPDGGTTMDTPVMGIPAVDAGTEAEAEPSAEVAAEPEPAAAETAGTGADPAVAADVAADVEADVEAEAPVTEPVAEDAAEPVDSAPHSAMQGLDKLPPILARVPAAAQSAESPHGPGSALPAADGSPPGEEFQIKGNADSMLYHTTDSPYYSRTKAAVWFRTEDDAKRAGFAPWSRRTRQQAKTAAAKQAAAERG